MQELQHIEFFQLRPSTRVKHIAKGLQKVIERRRKEIEQFEEKAKMIKHKASLVDEKINNEK